MRGETPTSWQLQQSRHIGSPNAVKSVATSPLPIPVIGFIARGTQRLICSKRGPLPELAQGWPRRAATVGQQPRARGGARRGGRPRLVAELPRVAPLAGGLGGGDEAVQQPEHEPRCRGKLNRHF